MDGFRYAVGIFVSCGTRTHTCRRGGVGHQGARKQDLGPAKERVELGKGGSSSQDPLQGETQVSKTRPGPPTRSPEVVAYFGQSVFAGLRHLVPSGPDKDRVFLNCVLNRDESHWPRARERLV